MAQSITVAPARLLGAVQNPPNNSRLSFVWLSWRQSFDDVVEGFEQAWGFFGGVFGVVIPDNLKAIVQRASDDDPRFNERFLDYAQSRGFVVDAARIRRPKDKPRVERTVPYVRESFFRGEVFYGLADGRRRAEAWCKTTAGLRIHGTTRQQPAVSFDVDEKPRLNPVPETAYDIPHFADVKVQHDQHFTVARALYSMPEVYVGKKVHVRVDRELVLGAVQNAPVRAGRPTCRDGGPARDWCGDQRNPMACRSGRAAGRPRSSRR